MIGKLTGRVDGIGEDWTILDVNGVGYIVHCSGRTLGRLQGMPGSVGLLVETRVREDAITLFGFIDSAEQAWFRQLTQVQGVGGRVALAILTALGPDELPRAIAAEDRRMLTRADGVGPKLAARIVSELRDRVAGIALAPAPAAPARGAAEDGPAGTPDEAAARDAVSALVNLGYGRSEAFGAVARAAQTAGAGASLQALIRAGLKELAA